MNLQVLGEIAEVKGELSEALDYYRTADRTLATSPVAAEYHGRLCRLLGYFDEAVESYKHAFELIGNNPSEYRQSLLSDYAVSLWHRGDLKEARADFSAAYSDSKPNTLVRALVAQDFGSFLWDQDELDDAEAKLREADVIYGQLEISKQFLRYETLNNLGGVLLAKGRYQESQKFLEASLALIADKIGKMNLAYAQVAANIVLNRSRFGAVHDADDYVKSLLARERDGGLTGHEAAAILGAVAEYFSEMSNFVQADEVLKRAAGILSREEAKGAAQTLLAKVAMKRIEAFLDANMLDNATTEFGKNTDLFADAVQPNTRGEVQLERIRGRLFLAERQWSDAISHLERSIAVARRTIGNDHPNLVWSLAPLARSYLAAKKTSESGLALEEAKRIANQWLSPNSRIWLELNEIASLAGNTRSEAVKSNKT